MALTHAAIIVIVLCACLAVTALGAALFKYYNPNEDPSLYNASYEQGQYMREVRMRNYGHMRAESIGAIKDLESNYTPSASGYYPPQHQPPHPQEYPQYSQPSHTTTTPL